MVAAHGCYRLDVDQSAIDYHQFQMFLAEAQWRLRQGQPRQARELAGQAIQLCRGRPLDDVRTNRADNWRQSFVTGSWLAANVTLLEALVELGEFDEVLRRLDDLQDGHPDDLALMKLRLASLHGLARYVEAAAYYLDQRRHLMSEYNDRAAEFLRQFYNTLTDAPPQSTLHRPTTGAVVVPRQLPHDIAGFVGRDRLLQAIDQAAELGSGVVLLDGMGGVGKTALAVHWAHRARHRFPDGDFFVNLNGFSASASVAAAAVVDDFLAALGHPADRGMTQRSKGLLLSRLLANRRTLVILDNARNSTHVKDLVDLLTNSLIIVTSRQRLTTLAVTTTARRVRVEPMTTAEAATLLATRLGERMPIDDQDRAGIARLCGGLPLAITVLTGELGAGNTTDLEMIRQLDRRQLITRLNDLAVFAWSYDALAAPERRLFRLLGLHPGPDISVAVACAYDGRTHSETTRSIGVLVGSHLLEPSAGPDRYRFHDLVREFALRRVEHEEPPNVRAAVQQRAVSHYLSAAQQAHRHLCSGQLTTPEFPLEDAFAPTIFGDVGQAQSWFDAERPNLIAITRSAADHGLHDRAWRLADAVAALCDRHGYDEDSRAIREVAVDSAVVIGDRQAVATLRMELGAAHMLLGNHAEARQCLDAGLRFAERTRNTRVQAATLHQLGRLEMVCGNPAAAITRYRQSLELARRIDEPAGLCWTHCSLGEALRILRQHEPALVHLHQAHCIAQQIEDASVRATALAEIGMLHHDQGDLHTAAVYCEHALQIMNTTPIPDPAVTTQVYIALAETNLARRDLTAATRYAQRVIAIAQRTYNTTSQARAHDILGDVRLADGERDVAVLAWQQAAELYERTGNTSHITVVRSKIDQAARGNAPTYKRFESTTSDTPNLWIGRERTYLSSVDQ